MKWQGIGAGIVQLIERPTEKQGTTQMRVRVPGHAAKNFQCGLVRCPHSPCVRSDLSTSVSSLKIPNQSHIPLFGHSKIVRIVIGMGGTALVARLLYHTQVRRPEFPARDQEVLKRKRHYKKGKIPISGQTCIF